MPQTAPQGNNDYILVLQGGGALGAYQAGVFEALCTTSHSPSWLAGISIGAINAALIAGNPPAERLGRLRQFWETVTASFPFPVVPASLEQWDQLSALQALWLGVPGFFVPRMPPAPFQPRGTTGALSFYDTAPLQDTLERLIDFDRINAGPTRLSLGAVNVRSGNFAYFDSARERIDVRHVLASGALPPGFPPVEIDGEWFWDGGLVSNTPLQYVLDQPDDRDRTVFQVDLFPARGPMPADMAQVAEREKDIRFSSRTRLNTDRELQLQAIARAAQRLLERLPRHLKEDPDAKALASLRPCRGVDVVHLIHRSKRVESQSKDYQFSRSAMQEHWQAGAEDMRRTLSHPDWVNRPPLDGQVRVFDLVAPRPEGGGGMQSKSVQAGDALAPAPG